MSRYLIELRQQSFRHNTVEADTEHEAHSLALVGIGDYGDPIATEVEVASTRLLESPSEA